MQFCLDDGANLIERIPETVASPTLVLPSSPEPQPTIKQAFAPDYAAAVSSPLAAKQKRKLWPWLLAGSVLLIIAVVFSISTFRRIMPPLRWQLIVAVDPATPNLDAVVKQTITVLERRLDGINVRSKVQPLGAGQIQISLPAVPDPERLKQFLVTGGKLELAHAISPPSPAPVQTYPTKEAAVASLYANGEIPPNRAVIPYREREVVGDAAQWIVVERPAIVTGSDLRNASAIPAERNGANHNYQIAFSLRPEGADRFGTWTGANINEYLAVVLNDEVKSVAYIRSQISDSGEITGNFTKETAEDLALALRSGALPAPLRLVAEKIDK